MENSINFLYTVFFLSILIHVLAAVITLSFVIPLQVREAKVKNGLRILRKQLLIKGVLALVIIVVAIVVLSLRYFISEPVTLRYITVTLVLVHALGILGKTWVDYQIYHQQYSPESKAMHSRIERLENEEVSREKILEKSQKKD